MAEEEPEFVPQKTKITEVKTVVNKENQNDLSFGDDQEEKKPIVAKPPVKKTLFEADSDEDEDKEDVGIRPPYKKSTDAPTI